jgi:peroxiredoxin
MRSLPQTIWSYNGSVELNRLAPDFELRDISGHTRRLSDYRGRIVIVNFWSAECPHAERTDRLILACLAQWGADVAILSVAANRSESTQTIIEVANTRGLPTVLVDAEHVVANLYEAQTTPHVFVVDRDGILRYHGAVDDVTFRQRMAKRFYLEEAVEALRAGRTVELTEMPAYGCTIVREI